MRDDKPGNDNGSNAKPAKTDKKGKHAVNPSTHRSHIWTEEEDRALAEAVQRFHERNWKEVAKCIPGKNDVQCQHRWQKVIDPKIRKGPWTEEEDKRLRELVDRFGTTNWRNHAEHIPGRIAKQCRERWGNHLDPMIDHAKFTEDDDELILRLYNEHGPQWSVIAKQFCDRAFKGSRRPDSAIKSHWNSTLKRKFASRIQHPGPSRPSSATKPTAATRNAENVHSSPDKTNSQSARIEGKTSRKRRSPETSTREGKRRAANGETADDVEEVTESSSQGRRGERAKTAPNQCHSPESRHITSTTRANPPHHAVLRTPEHANKENRVNASPRFTPQSKKNLSNKALFYEFGVASASSLTFRSTGNRFVIQNSRYHEVGSPRSPQNEPTPTVEPVQNGRAAEATSPMHLPHSMPQNSPPPHAVHNTDMFFATPVRNSEYLAPMTPTGRGTENPLQIGTPRALLGSPLYRPGSSMREFSPVARNAFSPSILLQDSPCGSQQGLYGRGGTDGKVRRRLMNDTKETDDTINMHYSGCDV